MEKWTKSKFSHWATRALTLPQVEALADQCDSLLMPTFPCEPPKHRMFCTWSLVIIQAALTMHGVSCDWWEPGLQTICVRRADKPKVFYPSIRELVDFVLVDVLLLSNLFCFPASSD